MYLEHPNLSDRDQTVAENPHYRIHGHFVMSSRTQQILHLSDKGHKAVREALDKLRAYALSLEEPTPLFLEIDAFWHNTLQDCSLAPSEKERDGYHWLYFPIDWLSPKWLKALEFADRV